MILTFRLRFHTSPGQTLWLAGAHPLPEHPVPLRYLNPEFWEVTLPLAPEAAQVPLTYSYLLRHADGAQTSDWGRQRALRAADFPASELLVHDTWNYAGFVENVFYTEPFKKVLLAGSRPVVKTTATGKSTHTFRVKAPLLADSQTICLLGEGASLGHWNTAAPILLDRPPRADDFTATVDLAGAPFPLAYKYGVFDVAAHSFVRFEDGPNRALWDEVGPGKHTVVNDGFAALPAVPWRAAGVAVPVFSLRSEQGFGVGEFADLKPLADWGKQTGLKLIQLLPINDTSATHTWKDSYPYAAISAFALHPLYLNLATVANAKNQKLLRALEPERLRLNALPAVDYEAVMSAKLGFLRKIFPSQKAATFRTPEYNSFFAENEPWLVPYAAFCVLRDRFGTPDFGQWPEHQKFDATAIATLAHGNDDVAFHFFVQYHLHRQLQDATAHIHAAGLVLKGDLAIGVYRHGADAWQQPELFHMDMQAGAPPDPFAAKGQNWGFPTYNWPRMAADGFAWWKLRFAQMGHYFDAFRIDHILGFFRIWSSPAHAVEAIIGHFVPALPLEPAEFASHGIFLDHRRFTQPFIINRVLEEMFGGETEQVRRNFLTILGRDHYGLRPEFATQRQVETYFAGQPVNERNAKLKNGLFDLISNVILLEVDGKYHFRIAMEQTSSFQHLPADTQARLRELYVDYFYRRQDGIWLREAMQKLPALKRVTNMLICGEDLGMVPACVPEVMRDLGFLSLEIQRMPKIPGREFSRPADAPYMSVVTPSTHDMSTIRGWWTEDRAFIQKFYNAELGFPGEAPTAATPEIVAAVVRQHLASPAMWSLFQWQELLGMDGRLRAADVDGERINVPAIPNYYWRYRLHLTVEQLQKETAFNTRLRELIRETGRG
jgi:4-alpha-glucanotransferase